MVFLFNFLKAKEWINLKFIFSPLISPNIITQVVSQIKRLEQSLDHAFGTLNILSFNHLPTKIL